MLSTQYTPPVAYCSTAGRVHRPATVAHQVGQPARHNPKGRKQRRLVSCAGLQRRVDTPQAACICSAQVQLVSHCNPTVEVCTARKPCPAPRSRDVPAHYRAVSLALLLQDDLSRAAPCTQAASLRINSRLDSVTLPSLRTIQNTFTACDASPACLQNPGLPACCDSASPAVGFLPTVPAAILRYGHLARSDLRCSCTSESTGAPGC